LFVLHVVLLCAPQFPDVGLAIELDDSCAISWDGRECAHCTSAATEVGGNELLSLFFSLPRNVMNAAQRMAELRAALVARAESTPQATEELKQHDRVWCKWWVDRSNDDGWYRATGHVVRTSAQGVTVAWTARKGTETTFTWQQARCALVHAGRLARRVTGEPQLCGAELVGRRVSVYWPGDDCMYSGKVVRYDARSRCHEIAYDDGDRLEEVLGSALSPEYVVLA
jgi:hypothetical protein